MVRKKEVVAEPLGLIINEATVQSAVMYLLGEIDDKDVWNRDELIKIIRKTFGTVLYHE